MAKYPGAALALAVIAHAAKHDRRPSQVYDDYLDHPWDYQLVFAYEAWAADEERKQMKQGQPSTAGPGRFREL